MSCLDEQNKTDNIQLVIYLPGQDADRDGFPDEGEEPFFCTEPGPLSEARRVPLFLDCQPSPPPE
jgi:hypothetical protein